LKWDSYKLTNGGDGETGNATCPSRRHLIPSPVTAHVLTKTCTDLRPRDFRSSLFLSSQAMKNILHSHMNLEEGAKNNKEKSKRWLMQISHCWSWWVFKTARITNSTRALHLPHLAHPTCSARTGTTFLRWPN
jgi:hypothetical protein